MELNKISERVYMLERHEATDKPYLFYIKGDNYSVAIDAGNSKSHVDYFYNKLKENDFPLPEYTIITHWHWDHTFGMWAVNGKTIASKLTNEKLMDVSKWNWTIEDMKQRERLGLDIEFCTNCILEQYKDLNEIKVVLADEVVDEKRVLDLGGVTLELITRDSTHSRDALFIYYKEEKMLFTGDGCYEDFYDNNGQYDKDKTISLIEFLKILDFEKEYSGHTDYNTKDKLLSFLNEQINTSK